MALETENKRLDPYTVSAGVKAAIEDRSKALYLVALMGDRVVGQLMVTLEWSDWRNGDIWWIQSVYVHPDFRKQGVFSRLHEQAEIEARAAGAVMLRLYVEEDNTRAQEVYLKQGIAMTSYRVMEKGLK
ncbi:MAG: GNAT family N-acetyltransferase [Burkholderiales bacterium]|nr:GNAT family N-acetyltransferase [Phycisphaerae bacterium]